MWVAISARTSSWTFLHNRLRAERESFVKVNLFDQSIAIIIGSFMRCHQILFFARIFLLKSLAHEMPWPKLNVFITNKATSKNCGEKSKYFCWKRKLWACGFRESGSLFYSWPRFKNYWLERRLSRAKKISHQIYSNSVRRTVFLRLHS